MTTSLFTFPGIGEVSQDSTGGIGVIRYLPGGERAWVADQPGSEDSPCLTETVAWEMLQRAPHTQLPAGYGCWGGTFLGYEW